VLIKSVIALVTLVPVTDCKKNDDYDPVQIQKKIRINTVVLPRGILATEEVVAFQDAPVFSGRSNHGLAFECGL
jgi:hypothetical protein